MKEKLLDLLSSPVEVNRYMLADILGIGERRVRSLIVELREEGVPIIGLPDGGYRLAQSDEEKAMLLNQYRSRAIAMFRTYSRLRHSFQVSGQEMLGEIINN